MAEIIRDNRELSQLALANEVPEPLASAKGRLWDVSSIEEVRWDKQYPYQLLVLRATGNRTFVRAATYTLPIPPQSIHRSTPFAIGLRVLQDGILEEHNAAPIRSIVLQGTTGVLPARAAGPPASNFFPHAVFAGTAAALLSVPGTAAPSSAIVDADFAPGAGLARRSGYYQHEVLKRFLLGYAELKRTAGGRPYRLALAMWKTREVLLVTPAGFDEVKSTSSPHRWSFTLSLRAWGCVDLEGPQASPDPPQRGSRDPAALRVTLGAVEAARRGLSRLKGVFQGLRVDVSAALLEPLRETALFCKDALGLPLAAADLPVNVVRDAKAAIVEAAGARASADAASQAMAGLSPRVRAEVRDLIESVRSFSSRSGRASTLAAGAAISPSEPDPANKVLEDPTEAYDFFAALRVGDLHLAPSSASLVAAERERVRQFGRAEFEARRDALYDLRDQLAAAVGAGSTDYDLATGHGSASAVREPTDADFEAMGHVGAAIQQLDGLVASDPRRESAPEFKFIADLARRAGIAFAEAKSKFVVPFPYGASLEGLALRYLGDPDRWIEIAALNGLRPPYVDEEGVDYPLAVNGASGEVLVAGLSAAVGQRIWLSSSTVPATIRRVTGVEERSPTTVALLLDGDPDLSAYKTQDGASVHAFARGTVNSLSVVAIPSNDPADEQDLELQSLPSSDLGEDPFALAGADLLLTQAGDAAIGVDGDWKVAVGLACVTQRLLTFVRVRRGSLIHAPEYGLHLQVGQSTADVSAADILASARALGQFDPVFSAISGAAVSKGGPTASVSVEVEVQGGKRRLPVSLEIR